MKQVDFYFDFMSPYSYLAAIQLADFSVKNNVLITWLPINLPKLIHRSGNVPPASIKNKASYCSEDLKRWATYLNVPFKMIWPGCFDSRPALRIASALQAEKRSKFCLAVFEALWSGDIDPREDTWLQDIFVLKDLPRDWLLLSADGFELEVELALQQGLFGVPSFVLHDESELELFFGVDHMDFLARACQSSKVAE